MKIGYIDEQGFIDEYLEIIKNEDTVGITLRDILFWSKDLPKGAVLTYEKDDYGYESFSFTYKRKATNQEIKQKEQERLKEKEIRKSALRKEAALLGLFITDKDE